MQARDKDDEQDEAGGDDVSLMEVEQGELLAPDKDVAAEEADEVDVVAELERPARRRRAAKSARSRDTDLAPLRSPIQRFMAETRRYPRLTTRRRSA